MCREHLFLAFIATLVVQCVTAFKFKDEHLNKRLVSYTIANQTGLAMGLCARTCMLIQQCHSLNYCMSTKTCELNALTSAEADPADFLTDNDWNYAENTIWPQKMVWTCENKACEQNQECMPLLPEAVCRNLPGCSAPQPFAHSTLKPGGTLVNTTRIYTCDAGYAAIGGAPTIARVCQNDGNWTNEDEFCHSLCTRGTYSPTAVEPCSPCPVGFYQPYIGHTVCYKCNTGQSTLFEGSTSASDCKIWSISQWVSSVADFSSEFDPVRFCAAQIIGVYDTYPSYGDIVTSWAPLIIDANQFIEVVFDTPVFITGVDIYETYKSGGTKKVSARDSAGNLHVLWETSGITVIEYSRIFSPPLTVFNSKSNQLRVDTDCTLADTWVEIDAIQLHGTLW